MKRKKRELSLHDLDVVCQVEHWFQNQHGANGKPVPLDVIATSLDEIAVRSEGESARGTYTKGMVGQCIRRVERWCGQSLFVRNKRLGYIGPTDDGAELVRRAIGIHDVLRSLKVQTPERRLAISLTSPILESILPEVSISEPLRTLMREVHVRFLDFAPELVATQLAARQTHLVIGFEGEWEASQCNAEKLGRSPVKFALVCDPNHVLRERASLDIGEVKDGEIIFFPEYPRLMHHMRKLEDRGCRCISVKSVAAVLAHVRLGAGIGIVPRFPWILDPVRQRGEIEYIDLTDFEANIVAWHHEKHAVAQDQRVFLEAFDVTLTRLQLGTEEIKGPAETFPKSVSGDWMLYGVSRSAEKHGRRWYGGKLTFKKSLAAAHGVTSVEGSYTDFGVTEEKNDEYHFRGTLSPRANKKAMLTLEAIPLKQGPLLPFVAVFSLCVRAGDQNLGTRAGGIPCLLGSWSGMDGADRTSAGLMILARKRLTHKQVRTLADHAQVQFLSNASDYLPRPELWNPIGTQ